MKSKKFIAPLMCISLGAAIGFAFFIWQEKSASGYSVAPKTSKAPVKANPVPEATPTTQNNSNTTALPKEVNISFPFITQAPFRAWSEHPFSHACEEASVLMVHYYLSGKTQANESRIREEILEMVDFQDKEYGFSDDSNAEETARIIRDYYGYKVKVVYDFSREDIKRELAKKNPVIVPALGRRLNNPFFTPPGPFYHMLVIKGYDEEGYITHDPGTYTKGENYRYPYDVLENAIHDFTPDQSEHGRRVMLVVEK